MCESCLKRQKIQRLWAESRRLFCFGEMDYIKESDDPEGRDDDK